MWRSAAAAAISIGMLHGLVACERSSEEIELDRIWSGEGDTPLELDPTDEYELSRWWTDGEQLLRLDSDGSYALFDGTSRYRPPRERGRWAQASYATLWLEPYERGASRRVRVAVSRVDDEIVLTIGEGESMFGADRPPPALGDRLVGSWEGRDGTLELAGDRSYTYMPARGADAAGHSGTWLLDEMTLRLVPSAAALDAIELEVEREVDHEDATPVFRLQGPGGALVRNR